MAKARRPNGFRNSRRPESADPKLLLDGLRAHQPHLVPSTAEFNFTVTQRAQRDTLIRARPTRTVRPP